MLVWMFCDIERQRAAFIYVHGHAMRSISSSDGPNDRRFVLKLIASKAWCLGSMLVLADGYGNIITIHRLRQKGDQSQRVRQVGSLGWKR